MREKWARYIVLLTSVLVVLLAAMFARIQNPPAPSIAVEKADRPAFPAARPDYDAKTQALFATGRRVFETQGCLACHAVAGKGNPRSPLDGVGKRRTAVAIRQWIIASADLKTITRLAHSGKTGLPSPARRRPDGPGRLSAKSAPCRQVMSADSRKTPVFINGYGRVRNNTFRVARGIILKPVISSLK